MTKADIGRRIHELVGISENDAETLLEEILELLKSTLQRGEEITITGLRTVRVPRRSAN